MGISEIPDSRRMLQIGYNSGYFHRPVFLSSVEDFPSLGGLDLPSEHSVILLVGDASGVASDVIYSVAEKLMGSGVVSVSTWGGDCERVHDVFDKADVGDGTVEKEFPTMTTWHDDETLEEAVSCFLGSTCPFDPFCDSCSYVAIVVGEPKLGEKVESVLFESEHLFGTSMPETLLNEFLSMFADGDFTGAASFLDKHRDGIDVDGYNAHPLLRAFVDRNNGHCYKPDHLKIADLLIPQSVRWFRDAVLTDNLEKIRDLLVEDAGLLEAEFTAGRGIARAVHHWKSNGLGEALVDAGADVEARTTRGDTPLGMQIRFGGIEGARLLLERGANPNNQEMYHIPSRSMSNFMDLLLEFGRVVRPDGMLHDAKHGFGKRVGIWLEYGVDPNARNSEGRTALHLFAARGTGKETIRTLVKSGADLEMPDAEGRTPLDLASAANCQSAAEELTKLGASK